MKIVIVIGGGAAGFFGAIACAEAAAGARVSILERGKEVLQKVKVSGGGRCNVTHACFVPKDLVKFYPRGSKALLGPFTRFCTGDTIDWFEKRGVKLKIEADGRMFPVTDKSQTIIDCLEGAAARAGVEVLCGVRVDALEPPGLDHPKWRIRSGERDFEADAVLMASGSNPAMWEILRGLGHTIVAPVPSLFTFNIKDPRIDGLAGVSVPDAAVRIPGTKLQSNGPLLITHWGLSGPGILRLSAWGARELAACDYRFELSINWIPGYTAEEIMEQLVEYRGELARQLIHARAQWALPARLWKRLLTAAGIGEALKWADVNNKQLRGLSEELTRGLYLANGKSTFKEEFVTAGGVALDEVHFKTFESKLLPGLFFAGEVLDIDAITGGFNFQAAWTGGWIAGKNMSLMMNDE